MAINPLQQYFRQPKIFIGLPSHGVYNKPGTLEGDIDRLPVFGMTGMDEILMKTPDALLNGESTVKVIASCCPSITNPWELSTIDLDLVLAAIRIATYGSDLNVVQTCPNCKTEQEFSLNLTALIDHYARCKFNNKLIVDNLSVTFKPLNYKQSTDFSLKNFQLQQQLGQVAKLEDEVERKKGISDIFQQLSSLQNDVLIEQVEKVDIGTTSVTEKGFIAEWIANSDSSVITKLKDHIEGNRKTWTMPTQKVECETCNSVIETSVELDQSNFFGHA